MLPSDLNDGVNVLIGKSVENLLSIAPCADKLRLTKYFQLMRYGRLRHIQRFCNVTDASLLVIQRIEDPDPRGIAEDLEQLRKIKQLVFIRNVFL